MTDQQFSPETYQSRLTYEQIAELLAPINPGRVAHTQGQSNMQSYDIRAELNRIFGFANWDGEALKMELVREHWGQNKGGNPAVSVVYRCQYRLTVYSSSGEKLATYTEWAMGDAVNFPEFKYSDAHDFAAKTAESQAMKRCAINLGDQYGLSLYAGGTVNPIVNWTLVQSRHQDPSQNVPQNRENPDVVPETDPDHGPTPEPLEGDLVDNGYTPPETPPAPDDTDAWRAENTRARTYGPVGFVRYIDWCYAVHAPSQVRASLPKQLTQLNTMAHEQGAPTADYNFGDTNV